MPPIGDDPASPPPPAAPARARPWKRGVDIVLALALLVPPLVAFWTARPYLLDIASHFLPHATLIMLALALGAFALRLRLAAIAGTVAAALVWASLWTSARHPSGPPAAQGELALRVVLYNAFGEHSRHDNDFNTWLRDQDADLIALIDPPWNYLTDQPWLRREYHAIVEPAQGLEWPILLLSRFPATVEELAPFSDDTRFSFVARRSMRISLPDGRELLFGSMHPPSPRTPKTWRDAINRVRIDGGVIASWRERNPLTPFIIAGDINSSPLGRVHRTFRDQSGAVGWASRVGGGTWHAKMPPIIAVPIDRVWTSRDLRVRSLIVGPRFRSDHRPVVADVVVPKLPPR